MIKHKIFFVPFLLIISIIFSGCSLHPQKMDADKVEEIVKEAVNTRVSLTNADPYVEDSYAGRQYTYSFVDERGIPFVVNVTSPYFSLTDYKKGVYEDYVEYRTDYRAAIMDYYHNQVEDMLDTVDGISFDEKDKEIIRVSEESALDCLEDILVKMDALYDFDYSYSGELRLELDNKAYWEDFRMYDLLIRYNVKQEDIFFTVSDDEPLSAEDIHEIIENLKRD